MIEHHFSGVSRLQACEASYVLSLAGRAVDSVYQRRGTAVHAAIERYVRALHDQGRGSDQALMERLITEEVRGALPPEEQDYAVGLLRDFAAGYDVAVPPGCEAYTEREMACLLYPDADGAILAEHVSPGALDAIRRGQPLVGKERREGAVLVVSTIDFMFWDAERTVCRIRDWKSNRAIKPASELRYALQTRFYAVQAFAFTGIENIQVSAVFLNGLREVPLDMGPEEVAAAALEVYQLCQRAEALATTEPRPSPGPACGICDVFHACPAAQAVVARFRGTQGPASLDPEEYVVAVAAVKAAESAFRSQAQVEPLRLAGGGSIGFKRKTRRKLREDWRDILRTDEGLGDDALVAMGGTQASIARWLRAQPEFSRRVSEITDRLVDEEVYTEFGVWGPGEE